MGAWLGRDDETGQAHCQEEKDRRKGQSAARKALDRRHKKEADQLKRHLLAEEPALQAHQERARKRKELEAPLDPARTQDPAPDRTRPRQRAVLNTADQRYEEARAKRREAHGRHGGTAIRGGAGMFWP